MRKNKSLLKSKLIDKRQHISKFLMLYILLALFIFIFGIYYGLNQKLTTYQGKAAEPPSPRPTIHQQIIGFTYLPKPGYYLRPKYCFRTGCTQSNNPCFITCRNGVFSCRDYLNGQISVIKNDKYYCQDYYILPTPLPSTSTLKTPTVIPRPTKVPTPTPEPYQKMESKYKEWLNNQSFNWEALMKMGAVFDLTDIQREELHKIMNEDIADPTLSKYVFETRNNEIINSFEYYPPENELFWVSVFSPNYDLSIRYPKTFAEWYPKNNLYSWKFNGRSLAPSYAWPHLIGVDKSKSFVWTAPDYDDYELFTLGEGYPKDGQELDIYRFDPLRVKPEQNIKGLQRIDFGTNQNKIFFQMVTQSSPIILVEVYKEGTDIFFRGVWISDPLSE